MEVEAKVKVTGVSEHTDECEHYSRWLDGYVWGIRFEHKKVGYPDTTCRCACHRVNTSQN